MSAKFSRDTPYFVDLKPGGKYVAKDLYEAGGVPVVMNELRKAGLVHEDCMTATGRSIGQELDAITRQADGRVIYPAATPITKTGGVVGLKGNLAPDGAIVKVAGIAPEHQVFTGPAHVFECEEDAFEAVQQRSYKEGEVLVIRNEGPAGGPGMREMLATTAALSGQGMGKKVALITDGRFFGRDTRVLRGPCGARGRARGADRPLAGRRRDLDRRGKGHHFGGAVGRRSGGAQGRLGRGRARRIYASGALWKYAQLVGPTRDGATTHPGAKAERHVYADL